MSRRQKYLLLVVVMAVAVGLRFFGLDRRLPSADEGHYRANMRNAYPFLKSGEFRTHSLTHIFAAPHGFGAMIGSYFTGRLVLRFFKPWLPTHHLKRDNLLARFFYSATSTLTILLLFLFSYRLFGYRAALFVSLLAAISPLLVNWGRSEYLDIPMTLFCLAAFYGTWEAGPQEDPYLLAFFSFLIGASTGVGLGIKWAAILIIPFILLAYYVLRYPKTGFKLTRNHLIFTTVFLLSFAGVALIFHSIESFSWSLSPDPQRVRDYPNTGSARLLLTWPLNYKTVTALLLLWGGPFFAFLLLGMAKMFFISLKNRENRDPRVLFLGILLVCSYVIVALQGQAWYLWRVYLPVSLCLLSSGLFLESLSNKSFKILIVLMVVCTLPLSLSFGLRLGNPIFEYSGSEFTYHDDLSMPYRDYFGY